MAIGDMYRKVCEVWTCGYSDMQVDTHRYTYCNILHPYPVLGEK